jgi:hypothetical protein
VPAVFCSADCDTSELFRRGDSNGVPYLPEFWKDLGPFLPPRNAYLLLRNTVYFDGHGIGQALTVLLAYAVIAGALLFVF